VATGTPSPTPNPNALKFTLDVTLPARINVTDPDDAAGDPFAEAVFAVDGVVGLFGVNDFVTISRRPDADWDAIVPAVQAAIQNHI